MTRIAAEFVVQRRPRARAIAIAIAIAKKLDLYRDYPVSKVGNGFARTVWQTVSATHRFPPGSGVRASPPTA